jgi:hypothetical protein
MPTEGSVHDFAEVGGLMSYGHVRFHQVQTLSVSAALCSIKREHAYLLPFAPFDWVDIVHAAPIPLAFDLRATRRCQMIEQVRQWVFRPIVGD